MNYRQALSVLEQAVSPGDDEPRRDVALYKAKLLDNLRDEERFGDTPTLSADRWRIVDALNPLAERLTGRSFTDLCLGLPPMDQRLDPGSGTPVVATPQPRAGGRPLTILPVIAHAGMSEEERQEERATREEAWAALSGQGDAELLPEVSPATPAALFDRIDMLAAPPDILHFVGHGKFLDGQAYLVLDKAGGGWAPTPVSQLAAQLRGVRLVVLASCQSAMVAATPGATPTMLTGAATAISATGVPLVLAMQLTVRTQAAYRLLAIFYRNLARGRSVQEALSRARHGLYSEEPEGASWYVPVLYVRSREQGPALLIQGGDRSRVG